MLLLPLLHTRTYPMSSYAHWRSGGSEHSSSLTTCCASISLSFIPEKTVLTRKLESRGLPLNSSARKRGIRKPCAARLSERVSRASCREGGGSCRAASGPSRSSHARRANWTALARTALAGEGLDVVLVAPRRELVLALGPAQATTTTTTTTILDHCSRA